MGLASAMVAAPLGVTMSLRLAARRPSGTVNRLKAERGG